jgi:hypothetical protein
MVPVERTLVRFLCIKASTLNCKNAFLLPNAKKRTKVRSTDLLIKLMEKQGNYLPHLQNCSYF